MTSSTIDYPRLMSLAVHEFRTPASVVGGYLRMLHRDGEPLTERQQKMIEEAEKSCGRLVALVNEMSELAKLDARLAKLADSPIDVFGLVQEVAAVVHEASERNVQLEARGPASGAMRSGDSTRLKSAFDAIFRSVMREKAGPCTVVADCRTETLDGQRYAIIVVAEAANVAASYERQAGEFDDHRGGLGLALPLARRAIEGHGGRLSAPEPIVENDPLTRGSAIITLPID
ncbi:MAG TPA: HAMP domain-containing sensor histidine kinase [Vicinamibacterales bacterium]